MVITKIHPSITDVRVMQSVAADDYPGFCMACGARHHGCEPDMREGECQECGALEVYGAEEVLIAGAFLWEGEADGS